MNCIVHISPFKSTNLVDDDNNDDESFKDHINLSHSTTKYKPAIYIPLQSNTKKKRNDDDDRMCACDGIILFLMGTLYPI